MAANRFQVSMAADSVLPKDRFVNVLWFEDIATSDQDGLCEDLAQIFNNNWFSAGTREIEVKSYEVGTPPNFPVGQAKINTGAAPASQIPREICLCLSFYSQNNVPRRRGRIYLPAVGATAGPAARPDSTLMNKALGLAQNFADLGGADVSWNVHSQTTGDDWEVTNAWVDDEWDTLRSRGRKPTTRVTSSPGS